MPDCELTGVLFRATDPVAEARFWASLLNERVVTTSDTFAIKHDGDLSLFFAPGPQKPRTRVNEDGTCSDKNSVHICWTTDDAGYTAERVRVLGGDVRVSSDRGISFLVFNSPQGNIDSCLLDASSWDEPPPDSWKRQIDDGHWIAPYYLTVDAPDIVPEAETSDGSSIKEYGHGISAQHWCRLLGGTVAPYAGSASGSFPFYVPLIDSRSSAMNSHSILFQRVQDGTRVRGLETSWVVPVFARRNSGGAHAVTTLTDPFDNEIVVL